MEDSNPPDDFAVEESSSQETDTPPAFEIGQDAKVKIDENNIHLILKQCLRAVSRPGRALLACFRIFEY